MATRIYLPSSGTPAITNATFATWTETTGADRVAAVTSRTSSAMTNKTQARTASAANNTWLDRQYIIGPLAGQTFGATTVKGTIRALESAVNDNVDAMRLSIRPVAPDGTTFRTTIYGPTNGTVAEFNTALRAKRLAVGGATTSSVITEGDYLVIEIGATATTGGVSISTSINYGDNSATDLGDNETDVAANNPFIEFAANMKFLQRGYGQAQADIKATDRDFGQAQADIKATSRGFGQAQVCVKGNGFGQAQAYIKITVRGYGQAQATIKRVQFSFGLANAQILHEPINNELVIRQILYGANDSQGASITFVTNGLVLPDSVIVIVVGSSDVAGFTFNGSDRTWLEVGVSVSDSYTRVLMFKSIGSGTSGSVSVDWTDGGEAAAVYFEIANASKVEHGIVEHNELTLIDVSKNAFSPYTIAPFVTVTSSDANLGTQYEVANDLHENGPTFGDVTTSIDLSRFTIVEPFLWPERWVASIAGAASYYDARFASLVLDIPQRPMVYAQAQAFIDKGAVVHGQAQADIKATSRGYGQAQADIKATSHGLAQSQADIKTTVQQFGQAQADIKATSYGLGQSQADIKTTYFGLGQTQSDIKAVGRGLGQAQGDIKATSTSCAQAQADIKAISRGFGQTQADIKATIYGFGQAQAQIKAIGVGAYGQVQADILVTTNGFGQAQALIRTTGYGLGQAQAQIKAIGRGLGQALAEIKQTYTQVAQANSFIAYNYAEDTFTRTLPTSLGDADVGGTWVILGNGSRSVNGSEGIHTPVTFHNSAILPQYRGRSFEAQLDVYIDVTVPTTESYLIELGRLGFVAQYFVSTTSGHIGIVFNGFGFTVSTGIFINEYFTIKIRAQLLNDRITVWTKVWKKTDPEPDWQITDTSSLYNNVSGVGNLLIQFGKTSDNETYRIDNLTVYEYMPSGFGQAQAFISKSAGYGQAQADILIANISQSAQARVRIGAGFSYYLKDTFTRTDTILGSPDIGPPYTNIDTNTTYSIDGSKLIVHSEPIYGYGNLYAENEDVGSYADSSIEFTIPTPSVPLEYIDITLALNEGSDQEVFFEIYGDDSPIDLENIRFYLRAYGDGGNYNRNESESGLITLAYDETYVIKVRHFKNIVAGKVWKKSDPEPDWMLIYYDVPIFEEIGRAWFYFEIDSDTLEPELWLDNYNITEVLNSSSGQTQALIRTTGYGLGQAGTSIKATTTGFGQANVRIGNGLYHYLKDTFTRTDTVLGSPDIGPSYESIDSNGEIYSIDGSKLVVSVDSEDEQGWIYAENNISGNADSSIEFIISNPNLNIIQYINIELGLNFKFVSGQFQNIFVDIATNGFPVDIDNVRLTLYVDNNINPNTYGRGEFIDNLSLTYNEIYVLKVRQFNNIAAAKVWKKSDPEPDWMITFNDVPIFENGGKAWNYFEIGSDTPTPEFELWFDNYNITEVLNSSSGQANVLIIVDASSQFGQAQADIKAISYGLGQTQADIMMTKNRFGQSQADIKATSNGLGQAQGDIKAVSYGLGQANADIKAAGYGSGQSSADIKTVGYGLGQTQCFIQSSTTGSGQANSDIKTTSSQFGQAQADIKTTGQGYGQAQCSVTINVAGYGQAQAAIKSTLQSSGQGAASIKKATSAFGQAQADVKSTLQGSGQAQTSIRVTVNSVAQVQAYIKATSKGFGQAQASVIGQNYGFGQAQGYVKLVGLIGCGQAQAFVIKASALAQAQALILQPHTLKSLVISDRATLGLIVNDRAVYPTLEIGERAQGTLIITNNNPITIAIGDRQTIGLDISDREF